MCMPLDFNRQMPSRWGTLYMAFKAGMHEDSPGSVYGGLMCCGACVQEKQKASERHIEELSERVQSLELEKRQLQMALERASTATKVRTCAELRLARLVNSGITGVQCVGSRAGFPMHLCRKCILC